MFKKIYIMNLHPCDLVCNYFKYNLRIIGKVKCDYRKIKMLISAGHKYILYWNVSFHISLS